MKFQWRLTPALQVLSAVATTKISGNRIIPARMPWVAAANSPHSQPQASEQTMATQRLHGVLRATRVKPAAIAQHRADCQLVGADQHQQRLDEQGLHCAGRRLRRTSISVRQAFRSARSAALTPTTGLLRRKTRSRGPISTAIKRKASRPCRLIALRNEAARASRFGTINPRRARKPSPTQPKCKSKHSPRTTPRAAMTAENSPGRCRRCPEQNEAWCSDPETMTAFGTTRPYDSTATAGAHAH